MTVIIDNDSVDHHVHAKLSHVAGIDGGAPGTYTPIRTQTTQGGGKKGRNSKNLDKIGIG